MLSIKATYTLFLSFFFVTVSATLSAEVEQEDNHEYIRQEAIYPLPLTIEVNTDRAKLGESLYKDTRLSENNTLSCAHCHQLENGGDDNVAMGLSISSEKNIINTPGIFNAAFNFRQNWDGSARSLYEQIDSLMTDQHQFNSSWQQAVTELKKDAALRDRFTALYLDGLTKQNIIDALVEYEKTLITPNSRFDRYLRYEKDVLSNEEIKGYTLFKELGCISCHQGINIGGNLYQKFGVFYDYLAEQGELTKADLGRINVSRRAMDEHVFKVPSLRNIAVTSPYFHDGSAETIEQAIAVMGKTQLSRELKVEEIILIKAFLMTLTGEYKGKMLDAQHYD